MASPSVARRSSWPRQPLSAQDAGSGRAAFVSFRPIVDETALKRAWQARCRTCSSESRTHWPAPKPRRSAPASRCAVIGADQVLALGDELFDKPGDLAAARGQLERLRGRTHRLLSAVVLAQEGRWSGPMSAKPPDHAPFQPAFLDRYLAMPAPVCRMSAPTRSRGSASSCSSASRATTSPSSGCRWCHCWPNSGRAECRRP